jgi:hypothetical protein
MVAAKTNPRATLRLMQAEDRDALAKAAAEDEHVVVAPTHVIEKDGKIVGYASLGMVTVLNTWVHSRHVTARDSVMLLREGEKLLAKTGAKVVCLPVAPNSPFLPFVEKLGYTRLGWAGYNLKQIGETNLPQRHRASVTLDPINKLKG